MKKNRKLIFNLGLLALVSTSLCGCKNKLKDSCAFMFKMTGNHFGESIYNGFSEVMSENNVPFYDKSPSEANVGSQVQLIETLTMQRVKSITISASGTTGYDQVLKRAVDSGVKIISTDSPISPKYRVTHVEHTRTNEVGKWLARAATLIALKVPYQESKNDEDDWSNKNLLKQPVIDALNARILSGEKTKIKFGIVSSTEDSPSQNEWIQYICKELQDSEDVELKGKYAEAGIDVSPDVHYGDDETKKSKDKAQYFIEKKVDVIIAPTTVAMSACATQIADAKTKTECNVKLTGLGMPSECFGNMPKGKDDPKSDFDYVCPYMMLWDVLELGKVAAKATLEAINGWEGNKVGESFIFDPANSGNEQTYVTEESEDGGTKIVALKPLPFTRYNIDYWKDIL